MRKELTREKTKKIISTLFLILTIADLKADDLFNAMSSNYTDYEDAIQEACATRIKADYIVTRNIKVFIEGSVQAIEPSEFLKILDL